MPHNFFAAIQPPFEQYNIPRLDRPVVYAHPPLAPTIPSPVPACNFHCKTFRLERTTQVVESYQKEAREEVEVVARDLEGIRALRVLHRMANGFVPQVRRGAGNFRSWDTHRHRVSISYGLEF